MADTTPYQVPKEPGRWRSLTLAVVVHLALLAFLYVGIRWQSETPVAVEAEVWSPQAKEAAPKPQPQPEVKPEPKPEVKPPPKAVEPKPDIALEQEKKKIAERKERERLEKVYEETAARKKAEAEAEKKAAADKLKKANEAKLAEQRRQEELKRMLAQAGGSGDAPKAQGPGRADPGYAQRVGAKIKSNTVFAVPEGLAGNTAVEYNVELLPDGSLRGVRKLKSSGVAGFDEAVQRAIERSQPYPADKSGVVPSSFLVVHKPKDQ